MMTQMLLLLHNLICHFAPLGQASHVLTFRGAVGGPRGVSETSAGTSHGRWPSCPQGPPTSSPGSRSGGGGSGQGTSQKKKISLGFALSKRVPRWGLPNLHRVWEATGSHNHHELSIFYMPGAILAFCLGHLSLLRHELLFLVYGPRNGILEIGKKVCTTSERPSTGHFLLTRHGGLHSAPSTVRISVRWDLS